MTDGVFTFGAFTHWALYTLGPLHTGPFTHWGLYTLGPLHTGAFTHWGLGICGLLAADVSDAQQPTPLIMLSFDQILPGSATIGQFTWGLRSLL